MEKFSEYRARAAETAQYPSATEKETFAYLTTGLTGEAGEIANKIKKFLRGDFELTDEKRFDLAKELGDVLWYVTEFGRQLGFHLEEIAQMNIDKLSERKSLGTIQGDGDGNRKEIVVGCKGLEKKYSETYDGHGLCITCFHKQTHPDDDPCRRCSTGEYDLWEAAVAEEPEKQLSLFNKCDENLKSKCDFSKFKESSYPCCDCKDGNMFKGNK